MNKFTMFLRELTGDPIRGEEVSANNVRYFTSITDINPIDKFCPECGRKLFDRYLWTEYDKKTGESTKVLKRSCIKNRC